MKHFWLVLLIATLGRAAGAQTNAAAPQVITITSHRGGFDMKKHLPIYSGDVRVNDPEMKLTCEWLTGILPHDGNPDRHIIAVTNVVIDLAGEKNRPGETNQQWHVTCDQAIYDFHRQGTTTNETVTVSGHAVAKSAEETVTGEPLVYDLVTKMFSGTDWKTTFNHAAFNLIGNGTNSSGGKTNRVFPP